MIPKALTMSEALAARSADIPCLEGIFPGSWISANFDVWIGDAEDVRAWDLLRAAREAYERARAQPNMLMQPPVRINRNASNVLSRLSLPPKAATGAGGTGPSITRQMTRTSTSSTASTSRKSTMRSASRLPKRWLIPSTARRNANAGSRSRPSSRRQK